MAVAASSVLETPATTTQRFCIYRLYQLLKQGGWTVWGSSDATSFSTAGVDHWSTSYASSAANNGAWVALLSPRGDNSRGVAISFASDGKFSLYYTIDGFSSAGVDADTPPTAVVTGAYVRNATNDTMTYLGASQTVGTLNVVVQDDGSFSYETYDGGTLTALIMYSTMYAVNANAVDQNCWYDGLTADGINFFVGHTSFKAFASGGAFKLFEATLLARANATYVGNFAYDNATSQHYINSVALLNPVEQWTIAGIPTWIKFNGTIGTTGDTFASKKWIKRVGANSNAIIPWDGVTASGTDRSAIEDFVFVDPETVGGGGGGGGGGTARLPGNGYHRSRRRPRE